jgi:hypothetical protein
MYKAPQVSHLELKDTINTDHDHHHSSHHHLSQPTHSEPTTMKVNTLSAATLALLTQTVLGDFSIYTANLQAKDFVNSKYGFQVYPVTEGVVTCDQAQGYIWQPTTDASGTKSGVRCAGDDGGCAPIGSGSGIKQLEFNTGPNGMGPAGLHFSKSCPSLRRSRRVSSSLRYWWLTSSLQLITPTAAEPSWTSWTSPSGLARRRPRRTIPVVSTKLEQPLGSASWTASRSLLRQTSRNHTEGETERKDDEDAFSRCLLVA